MSRRIFHLSSIINRKLLCLRISNVGTDIYPTLDNITLPKNYVDCRDLKKNGSLSTRNTIDNNTLTTNETAFIVESIENEKLTRESRNESNTGISGTVIAVIAG